MKVSLIHPSIVHAPDSFGSAKATDLKAIFKKATIFQKHSILREVLKGGLTYVGDAFRTPFLHPALAHNELIIKEKGLLFVEQPDQNFGESTGCSAIGI